jgi:hypothetical protein
MYRRGNRLDEGCGAAIHDRNFWTIDFDDHVIDVEATERRQKVFSGRTKRTLGVAKDGREFGCGDCAHIGADLALDGAVGCYALEDYPAVIVGRMERERNRTT